MIIVRANTYPFVELFESCNKSSCSCVLFRIAIPEFFVCAFVSFILSALLVVLLVSVVTLQNFRILLLGEYLISLVRVYIAL